MAAGVSTVQSNLLSFRDLIYVFDNVSWLVHHAVLVTAIERFMVAGLIIV